LSKGGKSSVISQHKSRLVGLSYVAKEVLEVGLRKGIQQVFLLLFSQASSRQAAEAPNQGPGAGPANCLLLSEWCCKRLQRLRRLRFNQFDYGSLAPRPKHTWYV